MSTSQELTRTAIVDTPVQMDDAVQVRPKTWQVMVLKNRVDSFTQGDLSGEIARIRESGHKDIALDLKHNRFFSLQAIQFCVTMAKELAEAGGALALIACPEKTKRHFEIYGSLKHIQIVRTERELQGSVKITEAPPITVTFQEAP